MSAALTVPACSSAAGGREGFACRRADTAGKLDPTPIRSGGGHTAAPPLADPMPRAHLTCCGRCWILLGANWVGSACRGAFNPASVSDTWAAVACSGRRAGALTLSARGRQEPVRLLQLASIAMLAAVLCMMAWRAQGPPALCLCVLGDLLKGLVGRVGLLCAALPGSRAPCHAAILMICQGRSRRSEPRRSSFAAAGSVRPPPVAAASSWHATGQQL